MIATVVIAIRLHRQLPIADWIEAALHPAGGNIAQLVFHFSTLPRVTMAALCGAALAVAGAIFQHVLRNPLASPVTLGVSSGAQLALVAVTIVAPQSLGAWPDLVALAGGVGSMALVLAIASTQNFSSLALILSGLSVGLFCGALGHVIKLFNQDYLAAVFLWGAGSFAQDGWSTVDALLPRIAVPLVATALLLRPMRVLALADESARGLGLSLAVFRTAALAIAVCLASSVTAAVGMVGFVEIAAPLVARLTGARRLGQRLVIAAVVGAALLVIVDSVVQALDAWFGTFFPTGAATAFLGAPLLIWLLPRMRTAALSGVVESHGPRLSAPAKRLGLLALLAGAALLLAILLGRTGAGWTLTAGPDWAVLSPWRLPRAIEAFAAGGMLATAGTLLQRATGNPMVSPEILGLGAAVIAGLAVALLVDPAPSRMALIAFGTGSAFLLLGFILWTGVRARFAPDHLLLTGVALTAALDAVIFAFLALNDGRANLLLGWMAGSTAGADATAAGILAALACMLIPASLVFARALDLMPLGEPVARGLGLALGPVRFGIMAVAALLTTAAVLATGPLTFVGLIGPHLARRLGLSRAGAQASGAALIGGLVMVAADWIGRVALAPFELPAGLVAALIGIPYLVTQLAHRPRAV